MTPTEQSVIFGTIITVMGSIICKLIDAYVKQSANSNKTQAIKKTMTSVPWRILCIILLLFALGFGIGAVSITVKNCTTCPNSIEDNACSAKFETTNVVKDLSEGKKIPVDLNGNGHADQLIIKQMKHNETLVLKLIVELSTGEKWESAMLDYGYSWNLADINQDGFLDFCYFGGNIYSDGYVGHFAGMVVLMKPYFFSSYITGPYIENFMTDTLSLSWTDLNCDEYLDLLVKYQPRGSKDFLMKVFLFDREIYRFKEYSRSFTCN